MRYREQLPAGCPPAEAVEILVARVIFRLVKANPPGLDDFRSQRAQKPTAIFQGVPECLACGLSVHAALEDSEKMRKLPRFKNRVICAVRLENGAGRIQQTFQRTHHTWWPLASFDILGHCEALA